MMAVMMIQHTQVSDEVALLNVNSHMMAVMMIQHSNVSDEVALFNVNSHMMAVIMIHPSKVSDEVALFNGITKYDLLFQFTQVSLSSKSSRRKCSVIFRYKSIRHV